LKHTLTPTTLIGGWWVKTINMQHEKIIKRDDGTQYQITVNVYISSRFSEEKVSYTCTLLARQKGMKKWLKVPDKLGEYAYRALSMEDRKKHQKENMLRYVSSEEIYQAKIEAWEMLKPSKD
jgi:hypothetical protein